MAITIVRRKSGLCYAYESTPRWDPEKKQARPIKRYLGRINPETGEIIESSGKRGRRKKEVANSTQPTDYEKLYQDAQRQMEKCSKEKEQLQNQVELLQKEVKGCQQKIKSYKHILSNIQKDLSLASRMEDNND